MNLSFNTKHSNIMHIDLNSCFATIEQQANPLLRGKPMAVAAYNSPKGCILAASREAKLYGVKTGMRVLDGKKLCPQLIVRPTDPWKYRNIHLSLRKLLQTYSADVVPKSIDEFVVNFEGYPALTQFGSVRGIAEQIKQDIKTDIGEWLTVSVGISTNRYLAKVAAGLHKPDGLDEINHLNVLEIFSKLALTDLCGIKDANALRLRCAGIPTVIDFYHATLPRLKAAFRSITSYYWYMRLHGYEVDDVSFGRRSYGNSYSLPIQYEKLSELAPILTKLVEKTTFRFRHAGYYAGGVHMSALYTNGEYTHKGQSVPYSLFDATDVYRVAYRLLEEFPRLPVRNLAVSVFKLHPNTTLQLSLFENQTKKQDKTKALDDLRTRWGDYIVGSARMLSAKQLIPDRIAFGGIKELEEFSISEFPDEGEQTTFS
jgi:DNA polymerase IV